MPGVPTEVLNEDIRELKVEIRDIRSDMNVIKADVHGIAIGLAELKAEVRAAIGVAKWALTALSTLTVGGIVSAVWWGGGINADVRNLQGQFTEIRTDLRNLQGQVAEIRSILLKDREPAPAVSAALPANGKEAPKPTASKSGDAPKP